MPVYILVWIFCFYGIDPDQKKAEQATTLIRVSGTCYNVGTGVGLKIRAFALFKKSKLTLGESNNSGVFEFRIPDSTKYLSFELRGYRTTRIPVNFLGTIANDSKFRIGVPMSATDSLPVKPINQLALCFTVPDTVDINYELTQLDNPAHFTFFEFKRGKHPYHFLVRDFRPGHYLLVASTADGRALLNEKMTTGSGLNFKAIYLKKPDESSIHSPAKPVDAYTAKQFDTKNLYFEQSSYELRQPAKATLDSVARFLANQPDIVAHVTGYTNNVGKRDLNVTLSEYRARIVMNYLRQQGVKPDQLVAVGKGPDSSETANDPEETRIRNRRVVIQFTRK